MVKEGINMTMLCNKLDKAELPLFLNMSKGKWIAEIKEDGDRVRAVVTPEGVALYNRRGVEVSDVYPELQDLKSDAESFMLDGEMCVLDDRGVSQFNTGITHRSHCKTPESIKKAMAGYKVTYVVFDVLSVNNEDLRQQDLEIRKQTLEHLNIRHPNVKLVEWTYDINDMWDRITQLGGEGIILKRLGSKYEENTRSNAWLKVKDIKEVDLVFSKFEDHNKGITIETAEGIRCVVNGSQAQEVKQHLLDDGQVKVTIRHLGQTETGKYRQPVYMKLVEPNR
jgi:bifunctional non-homologous end joining protein LigD